MFARYCGFAALGLACALARGEVVVELVPDPPGPYDGGEQVTVHVWLHSEIGYEVRFALIQFDFANSNPALALGPQFTFDYSTLTWEDYGYVRQPELSVPWTFNGLECVCPDYFLPLPAGGSLHIGALPVILPTAGGSYALDALNAGYAPPTHDAGGAMLWAWYGDNVLRTAYGGQITGGRMEFLVTPPPIPTMSKVGGLSLLALLTGCGIFFLKRLGRMVSHVESVT